MKWDEDFKQSMILFFIAGPGCLILLMYVEIEIIGGNRYKNTLIKPILTFVYFISLGILFDYSNFLSLLVNIILIWIWLIITNAYITYIPIYYLIGVYVGNKCKKQKWL